MAARKLEPLPSPPASLKDTELPLTAGAETLIRIHRLKRDPAFWGSTGNNRFDDPQSQYGVLYAAATFDGAFIETFGDLSPKTVSMESLTTRGAATVSPVRALRLVDLAGAGLSRLGLDARISTDDHAISQSWSRALWDHPSKPDGIWYAARHDANQRSVALFDRAKSSVSIAHQHGLMDARQRAATAQAIEKYGFALLP